MGTDVNTLNPASMEHLLLTLPIPKPDQLLQRLQTALPDLKITYLRHEVTPTEAFYKQDMYIPPEILCEVTILMTMSVVPDPADAPRLRYIHFNVAGIDHVAHKPALRSPNITVTTSTGGSAIAVAEWVFGSILMHARQLFQLKIWQNKNIWGRLSPSTPTTSLDGQKIGIIGYGSIGRQVARLAQAFGMQIVVYNSLPRLTTSDREDKNWYQPGSGDPDGSIPRAYFHGQSMEELHAFLSQNLNILVLSLPLTGSTRHMIGEQELAIINSKAPAFLVNVSRGPIINHDALIASLKKGPANGGLLAAALDVTEPEPLPEDSELWRLPNVFISPHVSSITPQTMGRAFKILEDNLLRKSKGQEMINVVSNTVARHLM